MKIALTIGHNSKSQGLFSKYLNSTEFEYNTRVANLVKSELPNSITGALPEIAFILWINIE